ncbi:YfcZ/YiiS family protein [Vibrio gallicus]|uniref:YfcZ/YiiS family protein n=1 Tax=Vibrio gallicus TaxID=190897 RepID=UPI0021C3D65D|nr:YfcZ/YiiS family protein [Vibrio gallicus]
MSQTYKEPEVCEACGVAGEMGFVIKEGQEVSEVSLYAASKEAVEAEFDKYLALALQVNQATEHKIEIIEGEQFELNAQFKFEVSAEKLIFDLKCRSLAR